MPHTKTRKSQFPRLENYQNLFSPTHILKSCMTKPLESTHLRHPIYVYAKSGGASRARLLPDVRGNYGGDLILGLYGPPSQTALLPLPPPPLLYKVEAMRLADKGGTALTQLLRSRHRHTNLEYQVCNIIVLEKNRK